MEKFYFKIENNGKNLYQNKFNPNEVIEPFRIQVGRYLIKGKNDPGFEFVSYVRNALNNLRFVNHEQYVIFCIIL